MKFYWLYLRFFFLKQIKLKTVHGWHSLIKAIEYLNLSHHQVYGRKRKRLKGFICCSLNYDALIIISHYILETQEIVVFTCIGTYKKYWKHWLKDAYLEIQRETGRAKIKEYSSWNLQNVSQSSLDSLH